MSDKKKKHKDEKHIESEKQQKWVKRIIKFLEWNKCNSKKLYELLFKKKKPVLLNQIFFCLLYCNILLLSIQNFYTFKYIFSEEYNDPHLRVYTVLQNIPQGDHSQSMYKRQLLEWK